jgi:hypothetical protein
LDNTNDYKIPLAELLQVLKAGGYELSIKQTLEIQSVLLSSPVARLKPGNLKLIITPILAKNEDEQASIYKIIDAYISEKRSTDRQPGFVARFQQKRRLVFALKITTFIMIVAAGILIYFMIGRNSTRLVKPIPPDPYRIDSSFRKDVLSDGDPSQPNTTTPSAQDPVPEYPAMEGPPIMAEAVNVNLQMSGIFGIVLGIILSYFLLYKKRKKLTLTGNQRTMFERGKDKEDISNLAQERIKNFEQMSVQFPGRDYLIQKPAQFPVIRATLKKTEFIEDGSIDIKQSIRGSVRNAGFRSVVYNGWHEQRKYLVISDNKVFEAHMPHLLDYLFSYLAAAKIHITRYTYTTDIRTVKDATGKTKKLSELLYQYSDHHLIITGDCHSFFDQQDLSIRKDKLAIFQRWSSKSIITPVSLLDWAYMEDQLQNNGFNIVPADIEAIELLAKAITENSTVTRARMFARIKDIYSVSNFDFQSPDELKAYLNNPSLFQAVCALAVYPKLKWSITLAVFSAIIKKDTLIAQHVKLDYDTLLKISRIPWLYTGKLDQSVRLELFKWLESNTEEIARETILELLREAKPPFDSMAFMEYDTQYNINAFFLYAHDQLKYHKYADSKNTITDYWKGLKEWALKERMEQKQGGLMPVNKNGEHVTVDEFVLRETQFEQQNIRFSRVALLTLPAILLYILFALFRPNFVYSDDRFKDVSFMLRIRRVPFCDQNPTHFTVFYNGKLDTVQLRTYGNINWQVKDVGYHQTVDLKFYIDSTFITSKTIVAKDSTVTVSTQCR